MNPVTIHFPDGPIVFNGSTTLFLGLGKLLIPRSCFFIFKVHLVAIGIIYVLVAFMGSMWLSLRVGHRVLVTL